MIWLMVLFFGIYCGCKAGASEELFLQAAHAYKNKDYEQAQNLYEKIEPKNAAVFYNLGNCAYKRDNFAQAYICWKKAERTASGVARRHIQRNIQECAEHLEHRENSTGVAKVATRVYTMLSRIPSGIVQLLFLVLWYCLWLVGLLRKTKRTVVVGLLMGAVGSGVLVAMKYYVDNSCYGLVSREGIHLYAGPNERFHELGDLAQLAMVSVKQKERDWYKITHASRTGWIPADALEIL